MSIIMAIEVYGFYLLMQKYRKSNRDLKRITSVNDGKVTIV
jgi:hypothetical protein